MNFLRALASSKFLNKEHKDLIEKVIELYQDKLNNFFFDKKMFDFHFKNKNELYFILKKPEIKIIRNIVKESFGLGFKVFLKKLSQ